MKHMEAFRKGNSQREFHQSFRSQSAMEYLMTYGWAILIIAVVLAALFELGIFNPMTFAPKASPGSCQVVRPEGAGTTNFISLEGECQGELPQYVFSSLTDSSTNGKYIVSSDPLSNIGTSTSAVTIVLWANPASYNTTTSGFWQNNIFEDFWAQQLVFGRNIRPGFPANTYVSCANFFATLNGSNWINGPCTSPLPLNEWYFVAISGRDGVGLTLYVNGVAVNTSTSSSNSVVGNGGTNIEIGSYGSGQYSWIYEFVGRLANIQVYNTTLSANDIKALYQEGIGGAPIKIQNLIGWWPLNGNANDYSGNGNNGVPSGVTYTSNWYSGYSAP